MIWTLKAGPCLNRRRQECIYSLMLLNLSCGQVCVTD